MSCCPTSACWLPGCARILVAVDLLVDAKPDAVAYYEIFGFLRLEPVLLFLVISKL